MATDEPKKNGPHFEDIMELAGDTGRWQVMFLFWMLLIVITNGYHLMAMAFMRETPDFLCADGYQQNVSFEWLSETRAERCLAPDGQPCRRWTYDPAFSGSSLVTQWDLVCERRPLLSTAQAVLQFGGLLGSFLAAVLGDKIGRRPVQHITMAVYVTGALLSVVPYSYELFVVARFVLGLGLSGIMVNTFVLIMEMMVMRWRLWAGQLMTVPLPLGEILLAAVAYKLRVWWQLQLALSAPMVIFILSIWIVPESPRWLFVQGRDAELLRVLRTIARVNGSKLPDDALMKKMLIDVRQCELVTTETVSETSQLWRSPLLRRWMLATIFCWATYNASYYGLSFDMTQLSKSRYLAGALSGLVAVPGSFMSPLIDRLGRRPVASVTFFLSGASMLFVLIDDDATLMLVAGLAGKMFISGAQSVLCFFTPEYIPTSVRSVGYGIADISARIGAMIAPYIVDLAGEWHRTAPSLTFGIWSLLAGLVVLVLPETTGRPMPETVAEVEAGLLDKPETKSKRFSRKPSTSSVKTLTSIADAVKDMGPS